MLPSLGFGAHLKAARETDPWLDALRQCIPPFRASVVQACARDPSRLPKARESVISLLQHVRQRLAPLHEAWRASLGEHIRDIVGPLHLPLLAFCATATRHPDPSLIRDISRGMPLSGVVPVSGSLPLRAMPATVSLQDLRANVRQQNARILRRMHPSADPELDEACWANTLDDEARGWLEDLRPLSPWDAANRLVSPRFAIWQSSGGQVKARVIDDFSVSQINQSVDASDTYRPENLDALASLARLQHQLQPSEPLSAWSLDFAHAYKNLGVDTASADVSSIVVWNPRERRTYIARMRTQPFGSSRAPASWGRVVSLLQRAVTQLLLTPILLYVDDVFSAEPSRTAWSAFTCTKKFFAMCGFDTSDHKDQVPAPSIDLLGARVEFIPRGMKCSITPVRQANLLATLCDILHRASLKPSAASRLRGKLSFAASLTAGRFGRAMLGPIAERQYQPKECASALSPRLRETILWWAAAIRTFPPRVLDFSPGQPWIVHSDASAPGHIAAVLDAQTEVVSFQCHAPAWFLGDARKHSAAPILEFELLAALLALTTVPNSNTRVLCFVDNLDAKAALVTGRATHDVASHIVHAFWYVAMMRTLTVWIDYVHTSSNLADRPSRQCALANPSQSTATGYPPARPATIPSVFQNLLETREALSVPRLRTGEPLPPKTLFQCPQFPVP